jgi:hypothetical protein
MFTLTRTPATRWTLSAAIVVVFGLAFACNGSDDSIGQSCSSGSDCEGISGSGYCTIDGICTRNCATHQDCGCKAGVTTDDIAAGACSHSCDMVLGVCMALCKNTVDCNGSATCDYYDDYPYTTCL